MKIEFIQVPADHLSDVSYMALYDTCPIFRIGFKQQCLINKLVYVTLDPLDDLGTLPLSAWRELRVKFRDFCSGHTLFAQTNSDQGCRFAEFFGFRQRVRMTDRIHLVWEGS